VRPGIRGPPACGCAEPPAGRRSLGVPVSESYDQRAAARTAAGLLATDLNRVSGLLEEVATVWRRAELYGQQPGSITPCSLQSAARGLADALRLLPEADSEQHPALVFAAVTQLAVLESDAARSATVTGALHLGDAEMWVTIQRALAQARNRLWSLIFCLARMGGRRPAEDMTGTRDAPSLKRPPWPDPPGRFGNWQQALAMQRAVIDALPDIEVRRLLVLIGGVDPAALQRAAVSYTDMFDAVPGMEGSVAALRPVVLAAPCHCVGGPGPGPRDSPLG
jgi:hypothetical protein